MSSRSAPTTRPSSAGSSSGSRPPTIAAVTSGLTLGDKVIVEGLQRVRPGQPVAPGPASALIQASMKAAAGRRRHANRWRQPPTRQAGGQDPMISAVFVDRPRLAIVIAFVITIAGALALLQIPVAQFPDIVPPQVTVTGVFPGASAEVVESSVAQPLEAQVVGVDKMLYMKSTSGNDGSYTLTVSFALGTNPDINTVNVNNRVQTALSQLPTEVQAQGLDGAEEVLGDPAVHRALQRTMASRIRCSSPTTPSSTCSTRFRARPGVGQASLFAQAELLDADLVRYAAAHQPQSGALRRHRRDPRPERAGAGRPHRRPADQRRAAVPVQRADAGQADHAGAVRQHRAAGQSGRLGAADQRRRPRRDRRAEPRQRVADRRPAPACRSASISRPAPMR